MSPKKVQAMQRYHEEQEEQSARLKGAHLSPLDLWDLKEKQVKTLQKENQMPGMDKGSLRKGSFHWRNAWNLY